MKFYWCHSESESIGICDTKEDLHKWLETPLIDEIDEDEFIQLKMYGWTE